MRYTLDPVRGIVFEFDEEIPLPDALATLRDISAQIEAIGNESIRGDAAAPVDSGAPEAQRPTAAA